MVSNPRYPNAFSITKSLQSSDGFGGGTKSETLLVEGYGSLQKGGEDTSGENKLLKYDWRVCLRFNDSKSVSSPPPEEKIGTDCVVSVIDAMNQERRGNILRVTPQAMGVDVYFDEENAN